MASPLIDNYGRRMDYLRLAVTERCDLRCRYCMPEQGIPLVPREEILTWEELERLSRLLVELGVRKIRITGGEPLVRKGVMEFLARLRQLPRKPVLAITTNGRLLRDRLPALRKLGIRRLNISLDSLTPDGFQRITRREGYAATRAAIDAAIAMGFLVKINTVVMPGWNDHELPAFAALTEQKNVTVRFIEPMPFNGQGREVPEPMTGGEIRRILEEQYPLEPVTDTDSTVATEFQIPGHRGKVGIIHGASRTFCSTCSRIRISARGQMRTCLYGMKVLDLRELLRTGVGDAEIREAVRQVISRRHKDGFDAEAHRKQQAFESMGSIGG